MKRASTSAEQAETKRRLEKGKQYITDRDRQETAKSGGGRDRKKTKTGAGRSVELNRLRQEDGWNRGMQKHGTTEARRRLEKGQALALNRQRQEGNLNKGRRKQSQE